MALDTRVHAGGGARGQNLGHLKFFFIYLFFLEIRTSLIIVFSVLFYYHVKKSFILAP